MEEDVTTTTTVETIPDASLDCVQTASPAPETPSTERAIDDIEAVEAEQDDGVKVGESPCETSETKESESMEIVEIVGAKDEKDEKDGKDVNMESDGTCDRPSIVSVFAFDDVPVQLTGAWSEFDDVPYNFLKGCKWAPDGSCILTNGDDNYLRIFNLPPEFYGDSANWEAMQEMRSAVKVREGELVYDYCWFPLMSSTDSTTCCFASTSRNNPVHMYDAYTGELRCSYRAFNQVDEIDSALSIQFDAGGRKLYCGFDKVVRIFDVDVPGRTFEERKTKLYGQYGLVSAIATNSAYNSLYACGSYLKSIGVYAESDGSLVCLLEGQQGGVTHLMFSSDGTKIYSGGRKDPEILCWDLRNPGELWCSMQREETNNQRMYFDIDGSSHYIASGNNSGTVNVWDLTTTTAETKESVLETKLTYCAHNDCVNGVSFHPTLPLMATASGQRKFPEPYHSDDSSDSDSSLFTEKYVVVDNSLRLWWCGHRRTES